MKKHVSNYILVLIFIIGLCVLLYPLVSDYWNSKTQSRAIANYEETLSYMTKENFASFFEAAEAYNEEIRNIDYPLMNFERANGYEELLNVMGTGLMGYIQIERFRLELPVYHGTSSDVLNVAVGHLEGTSLPTGGESTHCVLSAHRGLPSAKLFTDLDKLNLGDTFSMVILDRILVYEVDQILIVEPTDVNALMIEEGKDYCTLLTCTPYGINTHRMLVRGHRIETAKAQTKVYVQADAYRIDPMVVTPVVAAPMLLILLIVLLVRHRKGT